ncbi:hypothetical protein [Aridibaculum aurantiacum]|uniref:hypothetical protein n=1 Tax=Aridibaculum aurantiacum TaxID=2810307 RepID=UPI001A96394A|nr:hypothetical protein [Aridibaculum aurantiacum]
MANNDEEIRLDKGPEAANEPLMPGDNTIKPTDSPTTTDGVKFSDNANLEHNKTPTLDSAPDIQDKEGTTEQKSS